MSDRLLTAAEFAEHFALSTSTVLDWFEAGRLPGYKLGRAVRFRESEIEQWLQTLRVGRWRAREASISKRPIRRSSFVANTGKTAALVDATAHLRRVRAASHTRPTASIATTEPPRTYDPTVRADTSLRRAMSRAADFRLALRRFHSVTDRVARSAGLTSRQYLLLLILESSPPRTEMRVGELAETLNLVPSSMTELLDRAESAGLVERVDSAHDGRVTQVRTTAEGRRRLRNAFRELADERRVLAGTAIELLADE